MQQAVNTRVVCIHGHPKEHYVLGKGRRSQPFCGRFLPSAETGRNTYFMCVFVIDGIILGTITFTLNGIDPYVQDHTEKILTRQKENT